MHVLTIHQRPHQLSINGVRVVHVPATSCEYATAERPRPALIKKIGKSSYLRCAGSPGYQDPILLLYRSRT